MRVIIQRSLESNVSVNKKIVGKIEKGLVVLVGFTNNDSEKDIDYIIDKIIHLRIFNDENGVMNKSLLDIKGDVLSVSQFTLYADTKKGRRPSYKNALNPSCASKLYDLFNDKLRQYVSVETGIFGEDMKLSITNDGPVTIMLESDEKYEKNKL